MTARTPLLFATLIGTLGLIALLPLANAQTASSSTAPAATGTGAQSSSASSVDEATVILLRDRKRRVDGFKTYTLAASKAEKALQAAMRTYRTDRLESRVACREKLRRSNRDEQLPVSLQCLRAELTLERELVQAEISYAQALPGIPAHMGVLIHEPLQAMHDALNSFVTAVDKNVFDDLPSLLEARSNLHAHYRVPAGEAMTLLRADRALYWTSHLFDLLTKNEAAQDAAAGQNLESWENAKTCLTYGDALLRQVLLPEETEKRQTYLTAASDLQACTAQIAAIPDLTASSSASSSL